MTNIRDMLYELRDEKNAQFQAKLTPGIDPGLFMGIRIPQARALAKEVIKLPECDSFLNDLPHKYYDENILHSLLICQIKDYEQCVDEIDKFLPFVDNWAVCDTLIPAVFKKHRAELIHKVFIWSTSSHTYTCRFGIGTLMRHFLNEDFKPEYLELPSSIQSDEYYVNMMIAWFFATALAKQWDSVILYLKENRLSEWTHNKTIQKACESYRITTEQKTFLKTLRR